MNNVKCSSCNGSRLNKESRNFIINKKNIHELCSMDILSLKNGVDETNEIKSLNKKLIFTSKFNDLKKSNIFILCLQTPVKKNKGT